MESITTAGLIRHATTIVSSTVTQYSTTVESETSTDSPPASDLVGLTFSWYDYLIFCGLLSISLGIGIYFGCFGKKQNVKDYLHAGGNMKVLPVVISLVASHTSGITLLALPAEIYSFGANYWLCVISLWILAAVTTYVYLPVFYKLQLTSTYEYLGIRFDKRTRMLASILFTISVFLHLPIVTYVPAMAFASATGLDLHLVSPIVCGVCVFYTSIGGLKALVWSDTLQFSLTIGGLVAILALGVSKVGGIATVFKTAYEGHRLDLLDFQFDLIKRDSFWTIVIGFTIHFIGQMSIHQGCVQKFLAVKTHKESKWVVVLYTGIGMAFVKTLSILTGLTMYTKYSGCDPFTTKHIRHNNELMPYFVLHVARHIPGLSGLFIAGVFCASLSSLSTNLNSLAGTIYEDFVKARLSPKRQKNAGFYLKIFVVIIGTISTLMVYIVEHLGGLLQLSVGLSGLTGGPLLGLFTLGVLFPKVNANGAFYGAIASFGSLMTLVFGAYYLKTQHLIVAEHKPISTEGCNNATKIFLSHLSNTTATYPHTPPALEIFKISFYWYTMIGALGVIIFGIIISYFSKEQERPVARELLSPVIYGIIDSDKYINRMDLDYDEINMNPEGVASGGRRMSKWEEKRQERLRRGSYVSIVDS